MSVSGLAEMVNVSVGVMLELMFEDGRFRSLEGLRVTGKLTE